MKLHFLGTCAGTEPMLDRKHTSFVIESDGRLYWFDAGEGCSHTAHLMGLDLLSVCRVVISHTHMDHVGGLGNLFWNIRKLTTVGEKRPTRFDEIELYIPNLETWDGIRTVLNNTEGGFATQFKIVPKLVEDGVLFDDGVMRVTAFHNHHLRHNEGEPWRSFTYRIECEGQMLVYSGDLGSYSDMDEAIGEGCDAVIVETGHFGIDDVYGYMMQKEVGHVFFNHNGREVLSDREAAQKKLAEKFEGRATLCEDGMTVDLGEGMSPNDVTRLQKQLNQMMLRLGFEEISVNGRTNFCWENKYIMVSCQKKFVVVEIARGLSDAQNNLYEDLDLYEYAYMKKKGQDILKTIEADIVKYVVNDAPSSVRIGVIGDMHLGGNEHGIQSAFLARAVEQMENEGASLVINLGDITAFGELSAFDRCMEMLRPLGHFYVLGNSDIRNSDTRYKIMSRRQHPCFTVEGRTFVGLNTPAGEIEASEREALGTLRDGDVIFLHHDVDGLKEGSRAFMRALLERLELTVIHGHKHWQKEYTVGKSRVIGVRGIDPDKAIGDYPTVTYLDISADDIRVTHKPLTIAEGTPADLRSHMGISCVDNVRDVTYAIENGVKFIELRFNGKGEGWMPEPELSQLVEKWREKTGGYLSVHMPAFGWSDGQLSGEERFWHSLTLAKEWGADGLTVHVPSVRLGDMSQGSEAWEALLGCYVELVRRAGDKMAIGIENLHMKHGETDGDRNFGYAPHEVAVWIDAINEAVGQPGRVGHVLDVGHARNNGILASRYPVGRWYELMGDRTVAYHIHQTVRIDGELKNHRPLTDWFGPMISYASFLYAWETKMLNHVPVFLEVRGCDNFDQSVKAFEAVFDL